MAKASDSKDIPEGEPDHRQWPPMLAALSDVVKAYFRRQRERSPQQAEADANGVILEIANYLGGRIFYLPRGDRMKMALRDQQIFSRMGKEKADDLAAEFKLTVSQIYRIGRQQRQIGRARRNAGAQA